MKPVLELLAGRGLPASLLSTGQGHQHAEALLLHVSAHVQAGLSKQGITSPSPIQAASIPEVLSGSNVAIQSYTGSGKVSLTRGLLHHRGSFLMHRENGPPFHDLQPFWCSRPAPDIPEGLHKGTAQSSLLWRTLLASCCSSS